MGIFLDVAFQVGGDWGNPYLTPEQKWKRARIATGGALLSGGIGLTTGGALIATGVASGPAGWIGFGVGLAVDYFWGTVVTPWIYEARGLEPTRNLAPLQGVFP